MENKTIRRVEGKGIVFGAFKRHPWVRVFFSDGSVEDMYLFTFSLSRVLHRSNKMEGGFYNGKKN